MRVLLIEDNPGDAELVRKAFARTRLRCEIEWAKSLAEAVRRAAAEPFDVILADLSLPDSFGEQTVTTLCRDGSRWPVIVLTGTSDESAAAQSLDAGAQDYLEKDRLSPDTLERSIRYAICRHEVSAENVRLLRQVQEAKDVLERKNRRLERLYGAARRFVDHVSHEFRTPLSVIKEYASLIRDGVVGEVNGEQRRMLAIVDDRTDDLNTMVDDMLDVSRLRAGLLGVCRRECRVADIVGHVMPSLGRKAASRGVTLHGDIASDLPTVYCDEEKAGRVIVNLAVNAIKFSGRPGEVSISAVHRPAQREVAVSVRDNGRGLCPDDLHRIFRRFSQLTHNVPIAGKGFGLGLGIAKELVDLNLGSMAVQSKPNEGATFSFTLPVAEPGEVAARYLARLDGKRRGKAAVALLQASIDAADPDLATDIDRFLCYLLRKNDLLFRIGADRWCLVICAPELELERFLQRAERTRNDVNRNRPQTPLPPVEFCSFGHWRVRDSRAAILAQVEAMSRSLEALYV